MVLCRTAAINLMYVADLAKTGKSPAEGQQVVVPADAASSHRTFTCSARQKASQRLSGGLVPKEALAKQLKLRPEQRIILAQSVGHGK